jgi:hypothetical protein
MLVFISVAISFKTIVIRVYAIKSSLKYIELWILFWSKLVSQQLQSVKMPVEQTPKAALFSLR